MDKDHDKGLERSLIHVVGIKRNILGGELNLMRLALKGFLKMLLMTCLLNQDGDSSGM